MNLTTQRAAIVETKAVKGFHMEPYIEKKVPTTTLKTATNIHATLSM
jgi:hypothetical protein